MPIQNQTHQGTYLEKIYPDSAGIASTSQTIYVFLYKVLNLRRYQGHLS